jgi:hypothetical protein
MFLYGTDINGISLWNSPENLVEADLFRPLTNKRFSVRPVTGLQNYSVTVEWKSFRAEKSRTMPKKGAKTQPGFASGTTGTWLGGGPGE